MALARLYVLLWIQLIGQAVLCEDLPPPRDVHMVDPLLRWTPAPEHRDVTYTVQYRRFSIAHRWLDVPGCVQTKLTSCDVTSIKAEAEVKAKEMKEPELGCVELGVRAERHGLTSERVEACQGGPCSPDVQLKAWLSADRQTSGRLKVDLSKNHSIMEDLQVRHGGHAKHLVSYGREEEPLQEYGRSGSSVTIEDLEEGVRYCVKVQFILYNKAIGPPSCTQCEVIPQSSTKHNMLLAPIVASFAFVLLLISAIAYILIFQRGRIKRWMKPPYSMPESITQPLPKNCRFSSLPAEERYDVISVIPSQKSLV